jgi:hypothetical protein
MDTYIIFQLPIFFILGVLFTQCLQQILSFINSNICNDTLKQLKFCVTGGMVEQNIIIIVY